MIASFTDERASDGLKLMHMEAQVEQELKKIMLGAAVQLVKAFPLCLERGAGREDRHPPSYSVPKLSIMPTKDAYVPVMAHVIPINSMSTQKIL